METPTNWGLKGIRGWKIPLHLPGTAGKHRKHRRSPKQDKSLVPHSNSLPPFSHTRKALPTQNSPSLSPPPAAALPTFTPLPCRFVRWGRRLMGSVVVKAARAQSRINKRHGEGKYDPEHPAKTITTVITNAEIEGHLGDRSPGVILHLVRDCGKIGRRDPRK